MATEPAERTAIRADAVIVGAGHNGLVAACYLARAGLDVLVLERAEHVGGAAISAEVFPGVPARLSKYSYLVSLLPQAIVDDLGVDLELVHRTVSSFTPDPFDPVRGLVVHEDPERLEAEFARVTGDPEEGQRWQDFYARTRRMAEEIFPTLTSPLMAVEQMRSRIDAEDWTDFIERPLGDVIERSLTTDIARGVVLTDGLIGTFADAGDPSLRQNICFLYHVIGNGTGAWDVPVGGMGALTAQLADLARGWGARIVTGADVTSIVARDDGADVTVRVADEEWRVEASHVLANCAPAELDRLRGMRPRPPEGEETGAQIKVNMVLTRLPRLKDPTVDPEDAFAGTFHINENYSQLNDAAVAARSGRLPEPLPAEIYCHSLSDPSILGPELRSAGCQTLTMFVLQTPHSLFTSNTPPTREDIRRAVLATLDSVLAEPISDCLMRTPDGQECLEINTTVDIEGSLGIPTGNIFHTPLDWPWALTEAEVGTWGVETDAAALVLCGSGARRGGGVSGIPGHNAAQYVLGRVRASGGE